VGERGFDTTRVVSPFFGGGSFEFYMHEKHGSKLVVNDKFTPLYTFWSQCKENKSKLCGELKKLLNKVTKETFHGFRKKIIEEKDALTKAVYFFVINRCSFSGATLSGGFSEESSKKRFTRTSVEKVENLDLSGVDLHNEDFVDFLEHHGRDGKGFLFLDPPYYLEKNSKLYGTSGDMHETFDHEKLAECLRETDMPWLMTYNDCERIRELYAHCTIIDTSWSYGMNSSKKSSEIVIVP
jgi:DNA adenine methylase